MVPTPPGCPVPHALQEIERLGAPHLADRNPVGRSRSDERTRSDSDATPSLVRMRDEVGRGALQFARILDEDDAVGPTRDLAAAVHW